MEHQNVRLQWLRNRKGILVDVDVWWSGFHEPTRYFEWIFTQVAGPRRQLQYGCLLQWGDSFESRQQFMWYGLWNRLAFIATSKVPLQSVRAILLTKRAPIKQTWSSLEFNPTDLAITKAGTHLARFDGQKVTIPLDWCPWDLNHGP